MKTWGLGLLTACLFIVSAAAEEEKKDSGPIPDPKVFTTEHQGRFNGQSVKYTVTAGETYLHDEKDKPIASIWSIAYVANTKGNSSNRPVTFVFNGGPGSASLWLHMGVFGPKRINLPSDAMDDGAPPYDIINNDQSPLDVTDLVFIDPVGTGYSRPLGDTEGKEFWGVDQDAKSIAEFVRIWITKNKRWNSPRYIAGESYGTTRAAALTDKLQDGFNGISVNGVILISAILDFQTARFQTGNPLPFIGFLPTYAATHWYHNLKDTGSVTLADHVAEARRFAVEDYAPALLKGDRLNDAEKAAIRSKLSDLTGLSEDYLDDTNLRINIARFAKEFGRDEGFTVGRFDSRFKGKDFDDAGENYDDDPSGYAIAGGYTSAINHYMATELGVDLTREYKVLDFTPGRNWDWSQDGSGRGFGNINVAPMLGEAMRENSDLRVLLACGYYDLATPFFAAETTLATNGFVKDRTVKTFYEAGHMMYLHHPSLAKLSKDIRDFILAGKK
ncbi:MAG: peptidase S10 [Sphingomonadales bacterium]|jgi:carboxypeptidase C (cathepsin A)